MKRKAKEIKITTPEGEVLRYPTLTETCNTFEWSYNYLKTLDINQGFDYRNHHLIKVYRGED